MFTNRSGPPESRSRHLGIKRSLLTVVGCRSGRARRLFSRNRVVSCRSRLVVLQKYEAYNEVCFGISVLTRTDQTAPAEID